MLLNGWAQAETLNFCDVRSLTSMLTSLKLTFNPPVPNPTRTLRRGTDPTHSRLLLSLFVKENRFYCDLPE